MTDDDAQRRQPPRRRRTDDDPVLPDRPRDERGSAWGDRADERSDDWYRRERPPHHE